MKKILNMFLMFIPYDSAILFLDMYYNEINKNTKNIYNLYL